MILIVMMRFVDRDMFMRYLGGAPGHTRRGASTAPSMTAYTEEQLDVGSQEPDQQSYRLRPATRKRSAEEVIEEEEEDWYMDDDEEGMQPHAGDISEEEDIPGDDEFTYALAGLTV